MSSLESQTLEKVRLDGRCIVKTAVAAFLLFTLAGGMLWWRFGATIFFDMLSFAQACF